MSIAEFSIKNRLIAGIVVELLYAVYVYYLATATEVAYQPIGMAIAFALFALGGFWAGRPAEGSRLAVGLGVGIVGTLFYYALNIQDIIAGEQTYPPLAWVNHGLKLAGGAAGALLAGVLAKPQG